MKRRRSVKRPLSALAGPIAAVALLVAVAVTVSVVAPARDDSAASPAIASATPSASTTPLVAVATSAPSVATTPSPAASPTDSATTRVTPPPAPTAEPRHTPTPTAEPTHTATPSLRAVGAKPYLALCAARDLDVRIDGWTVTAAATVISVTLENTGSETCAVHWRYRVGVSDAGGKELLASADPGRDEPVRQLRAGEAVTGVVEWRSWCETGSRPAAVELLLPSGKEGHAVAMELPSRLPLPTCAGEEASAITPFVVRDLYRPVSAFAPPDDVTLSADQRTLTLTISGTAPFKHDDLCSSDYAATILAHGGELAVGLLEVRYGRPEPPAEMTCPEQSYGMGHQRRLDVSLAAPFRGSTVRSSDLYASVYLVRPPDRLLRPTALPDGWELLLEGDPADTRTGMGSEGDFAFASTGYWFQIYSPLARLPELVQHDTRHPRGVLELSQGFDEDMEEFGTAGQRVTVNGSPAVLYEIPEATVVELYWRVGNDQLLLRANDLDFSGDQLIRLAESAVARVPADPAPPGDEDFPGCSLSSETCKLAPGTYAPARTTPRIRFTVDEGWELYGSEADGIVISKWLGELSSTLSMSRDITAGYDRPIEPGPPGLRDYLVSHPELRVERVEDTVVGGAPGLQLDVVALDDADIYWAGDDSFSLAARQKARFFLLDVRGTTVVLSYDSPNAREFPAAVAVAQPVIDSWEFPRQ